MIDDKLSLMIAKYLRTEAIIEDVTRCYSRDGVEYLVIMTTDKQQLTVTITIDQ